MKRLERETGLEPATSSLGSWHSTTELLPLLGARIHIQTFSEILAQLEYSIIVSTYPICSQRLEPDVLDNEMC